jgi:hypothetical protein
MLISGKVFEYLASRSPIIAVCSPTGDAARLMKQCNRNETIGFDDKQKMKELLLEYFNQWLLQNGNVKHAGNEHYAFSREAQCKNFAAILNQLVGK